MAADKMQVRLACTERTSRKKGKKEINGGMNKIIGEVDIE